MNDVIIIIVIVIIIGLEKKECLLDFGYILEVSDESQVYASCKYTDQLSSLTIMTRCVFLQVRDGATFGSFTLGENQESRKQLIVIHWGA